MLSTGQTGTEVGDVTECPAEDGPPDQIDLKRSILDDDLELLLIHSVSPNFTPSVVDCRVPCRLN